MNTPENMKAFDLQQAITGHPLVTRNGKVAKFIAYVPENEEGWQLITTVDGQVVSSYKDGSMYATNCGESVSDLFLAPLGYCEGLPVFAGDKLVNKYTGYEFIVEADRDSFENNKWPSKLPVVETRMTEEILCSTFFNAGPVAPAMEVVAWKRIANKAIERSIADGDVIPTSLFVKIAGTVYNERVSSNDKSFAEIAESVLNKYLEGLK